jgi:hydrogenase expression/formation protein HypC
VEVISEVALVDFQGNRMEVSALLTPEAGPGDWVLVHAGFAITMIDEAAAKETWTYLRELHGSEASAAGSDAGATDE